MDLLIRYSWMASALYGIWLGQDGIRRARCRLKILEEVGLNGLRKISANSVVRRETVRLIIAALATTVGLSAIFFPGAAGPWLGVILVVYQFLIVYNQHADRRDDLRMEKEIEQAEKRATTKAEK